MCVSGYKKGIQKGAVMFSWGEMTTDNFGVQLTDLVENKSDGGTQFMQMTKQIITTFSASTSVVTYNKSNGNTYFLRRQRDQDGNVTFGKPKNVTCRQHIDVVRTGDAHLLLLTRDGIVFYVDLSRPTIRRSLQNVLGKRAIQVACGDQHSIVLTEDGQVFTWGNNSHGQLGLTVQPDESHVVLSPEPVKRISGLPLAQVAAGGNHSFALSLSGTVIGWGQNDAGQLGIGDRTDRYTPVTVDCLNLKKTVSISCGERHTAVLTKGGVVFTFGSGSYGQLGHNSLLDEIKPRLVAELWGAIVIQITCGSNHTMAFVGSTNKIYSFGRGEEGQLGNRVTTDCAVPLPVLLPHEGDKVIQQIFAGGNQSFALCCLGQEPEREVTSSITGLTTLDEVIINYWLSKCQNPKSWRKIKKQIQHIFSHASCLNASFLERSYDKHYQTSPRCSGLDLSQVSAAFEMLAKNDKVLKEIETVVQGCLLPTLGTEPIGVEGLRVYLILTELLKVLVQRIHDTELALGVADAILLLHPDNQRVLVGLWSRTPIFFRSAVKTFCNVATNYLDKMNVQYLDHDSLMKTLKVLQVLYSVGSKGPQRLSPSVFHVNIVRDVIMTFMQLQNISEGLWHNWFPLTDDEIAIIENAKFYQKTLLSLEKYPCILPKLCKMALWVLELSQTKNLGYIRLLVNRHTLQRDTFEGLRAEAHDFSKHLQVKFVEEDGFDLGGVSMEFFHLLAKELLVSEPQILEVNEHGLAWFTQDDAHVTDECCLLGVLCGMALYNKCLLNISFPLALFKKLLGLEPSMEDLMEMSPTAAQSLMALLDYDEEVVEEMQLDFGWSTEQDLLPNGQQIPVTKVNRKKYVDLYVNMVFNKSVERQFTDFERGFLQGCPSPAWKMFLPDELMTLLRGEEIFNWEDLRKNANYLGCSSTDKVIQNFWTVFTEFSVEQKKDFLRFLTGTNRIPKSRSSTINVKIKLTCWADPDEHYPAAETCFWALNLPNYSNIEILRQKLLHAVECCDVFGQQ